MKPEALPGNFWSIDARGNDNFAYHPPEVDAYQEGRRHD
jgi:hypothetical protein